MNVESQKMINHLILNFHNIENLGLLAGRMGGVLFFHNYARFSNRPHYSDYAESLLISVYDDINTQTPLDFASGLCGIGWGIEYLVQNDLLKGNTDTILDEIDKQIISSELNVFDKSLETGVLGIIYYVLARLESFKRDSIFNTFTNDYLIRLKEIIMETSFDGYDSILTRLDNCLRRNEIDYSNAPKIEAPFYSNLPSIDKSFFHYELGMQNGLTGILFKTLFP